MRIRKNISWRIKRRRERRKKRRRMIGKIIILIIIKIRRIMIDKDKDVYRNYYEEIHRRD